MKPFPSSLQQKAHIADDRVAVGRRHLLYDLEKHPFEASPLTQLFTVISKRRPSWWKKELSDDKNTSTTLDAGASPLKSAHNTTAQSSRTNAPEGIAPNENTMIHTPSLTSAPATDEEELPPIPDTVVWENNIPKGWFYFDPKERHVLRRKVETRAIMAAFLRRATYADDVVATLYTSVTQTESGDPAVEYHFITAAALERFLFENGRGKGTAILQAFVPSLHSARNDVIEAIWTPSVVHVSRRQNIHEIADDRHDINDRCITFEGKTHLSRLVQCTSRLRRSVVRAVLLVVRHFHETDPRHVINRFVGRFKMNADSQLVLLQCVSVRVMPAAPSSMVQDRTTTDGNTANSRKLGSAVKGAKGALIGQRDEHSLALPAYTVAAPDGGGSAFYKHYRVCLDLAVHYELRKPPAVNRDNRSVMTRLQEQSEADRIEFCRSRHHPDHHDQQGGHSQKATLSPLRASSAMASTSGLNTDEWMDIESPDRSPVGSKRRAITPMLGTQKASHYGFVVRPNRQELAASKTLSSNTPRSERSVSPLPTTSATGHHSTEAAVRALVSSAPFKDVATATPDQQLRVCRILDKCVRKAGHAAVRLALLQAHEEDLNDAERMELLALMMQKGHWSSSSSSSRFRPSPPRQPSQRRTVSSAAGGGGTWSAVEGILDDAVYQIAVCAQQSCADIAFPHMCPNGSCTASKLFEGAADELARLGKAECSGRHHDKRSALKQLQMFLESEHCCNVAGRPPSASVYEVAASVAVTAAINLIADAPIDVRASVLRDAELHSVTLRLELIQEGPSSADQLSGRFRIATKAVLRSIEHINVQLRDQQDLVLDHPEHLRDGDGRLLVQEEGVPCPNTQLPEIAATSAEEESQRSQPDDSPPSTKESLNEEDRNAVVHAEEGELVQP